MLKEEVKLNNFITIIKEQDLIENWNKISKYCKNDASMVLKADAYGLKVKNIAPILYNAGCSIFWVATLNEAVDLRSILEKHSPNSSNVTIYVLAGVEGKKQCKIIDKYKLTPALNSVNQIKTWLEYNTQTQQSLPCALHIDTGINRLSIVTDEQQYFKQNNTLLQKLNLKLVFSHLSSSDEINNTENQNQKQKFEKIIESLKLDHIPKSLAASDGSLLGKEYHYDLCRLGTIVYGYSPLFKDKTINKLEFTEKLKSVIQMFGKVISIHELQKGSSTGYGKLYTAKKTHLVATIQGGYACGILKKLYYEHKEKSYFLINNQKAYIIGNISMDYIVLDISNVKELNNFDYINKPLENIWATISGNKNNLYQWLVSAPELFCSQEERSLRFVYNKSTEHLLPPEIINFID